MADPDQARELAADILSDRRFRDPEVPRPFERPLGWLGDRLGDIGGWLAGRFDGIDAFLPGGAWVVWVLIGLAVAGLAVAIAKAFDGRAVAAVARTAVARATVLDPAELERDADAAERSGDYERAVRLRFRAGVARLERARVLEPGGLRTTGEIAGVLRSADFETLGTDFDAIAYGGRAAREADAAASREGWRAVLAR